MRQLLEYDREGRLESSRERKVLVIPDFVRTVTLYALIPGMAVVIGGVLAARYPPGPRLRSIFQHVAAGVVFAAVAGELLPEITAMGDVTGVIVGFAIGIALMLAVRELTKPAARAGEDDGNGKGLIITVGVDLLIDGLLVGIGFAAGAEVGVLVTLALTLEVLFLGLATAASLARTGASQTRLVITSIGLGSLIVLSAIVGAVILGGISGTPYAAVLGFGSAALLYLVTEELLVEAHEVRETPLATASFFMGFLVLLVIEMVA
jgi:zinc transporter, ZIP family